MKLYGLIGYPLGHSFSKKYFTEKFQREQLTDCSYELFPIDSIDKLPELLEQNPSLQGLNVTIPYKEKVLQFVSTSTDEVKKIGAANTIKISGGKLTAYNTDVTGFEISFKKKLKPHHKKALILGTGGSSKAVQYVLKKLGMEYLVVSRTDKGNISYNSVNENLIDEYPAIINCSPAGMYPNEDQYPQLPYDSLSEKNYLFDLVYRPEKTIFLMKGEQRGATIQNGYEMLEIQAVESWKIWNEEGINKL